MEGVSKKLLAYAALWLPKILMSLLMFAVFWILSRIALRTIINAGEQLSDRDHITNLLAKTAQHALMLFGAVVALGTLGVDVTALVAGLGLTGFALGFALKDTISNLLAGFLLLIYRPFKVDDRIKVSGYEGKVICIDLRYTTLEGEESNTLIPNSNLFTTPITLYKK
ncbi:mechanosensitive ion channel family protein [Candidatus Riflebacteria bacterium]